MKIVVLKGNSPRHNFFAKSILNIENVECKLICHNRLGSKRLIKMIKKTPWTFFSRVGKYVYFFFTGWDKKEAAFFGQPAFTGELKVDNLNDSSTIEIIKDFAPDLIVSFGIPIISDRIISIPKYGAINLHGGVSPYYKGGNTIFWALLNDEANLAGATIHYMVNKVDSGDILVKIYPEIDPRDDELSVSVKTFKYATEEFSTLIRNLIIKKQALRGQKQSEKGKLYLAKDRTLLKSIWGSYRIKKNLKKVSLKKRIERFY